LTRYYAGTWKTIVQQAAETTGMSVEIIRATPEPVDKITDPTVIATTVAQWQTLIAHGLGVEVQWPEDGDLPYWTDKPDWDGYGAVVLRSGGDYPSLLSGVEWWLPMEEGPSVFAAHDVGGRKRRMSRVDVLSDELGRLNRATLDLDQAALESAGQMGPPAPGSPAEQVAPFGLAVLTRLVREAKSHRQPPILDY
jgi:hypothetical protein